MRGRHWVAALLAAGVLLGAGHTTAVAAPAATAVVGPCPGTTGVTEVVDLTAFGGGVRIACAQGRPTTGLDALAMAGFSVVQAQDFPGAVCRIDGFPGADQQDCVGMPPANAYWSYWQAGRGGSWVYSAVGAATTHPVQGSVEGWAFGPNRPPGVAPPAAPLPTPRPTPSPTPRPVVTRTPGPTGGASPTLPVVSAPPPSESAGPTLVPGPPTSGGAAATAPSESPQAPPPTDAPTAPAVPAASSPAGDPGAPPVGTILGIGLIAVLLAGGQLLARRTRRPRS